MSLLASCRELAAAAADGSFDEGPGWLRLKLRLHWLACWVCRRYVAQLRWLDRAAASLWTARADDAALRARLKERLR